MLEQLKTETKANHNGVEKVMVEELKKLSSLNDYATLLVKLYTFYFPIENQLHAILDKSVIPDIEYRRHVHRLVDDLIALGYNINDVPANQSSLQIKDAPYALGVLYVIEGSTLGGQIISKMLQKQLGLMDASQIAYFNSYRDKTAIMWANYKSQITKMEAEIDWEKMILGAKDTFFALENWLANHSITT